MAEKMKITFMVEFPDGSAQRLDREIDQPDWKAISAGDLRELSMLGEIAAMQEFSRRDNAAQHFCAPLARQLTSWLRRVGRDLLNGYGSVH